MFLPFRIFSAVLCVSMLGMAEANEPKHGEFGSETVKTANATRQYRLVVPKSVNLSKPAPLVIAFHGLLIDSKDVMPKYTKLNETAEKNKFLSRIS